MDRSQRRQPKQQPEQSGHRGRPGEQKSQKSCAEPDPQQTPPTTARTRTKRPRKAADIKPVAVTENPLSQSAGTPDVTPQIQCTSATPHSEVDSSITDQTSRKEVNLLAGTEDFFELVVDGGLFVDKSEMIAEVVNDNDAKLIIITRPRRWGKSLNLSMLKAFLEIEVNADGSSVEQKTNNKLFMGGTVYSEKRRKNVLLKPLKITQNKKVMEFQGQFPVIFVSFKEVFSAVGYEENLKVRIKFLFKKHKYLINSDKLTRDDKDLFDDYCKGVMSTSCLRDSLRFLSQLLHLHFGKKVYILIDEYDAPINDAYTTGFAKKSEEDFKLLVGLFRGLYGAALKTNEYLMQGILTGILFFVQNDMLSSLNNATKYSLLHKKYSGSYGFTEEDVVFLLKNLLPEQTDLINTIKYWYNGYTFGGKQMYNPWSIVQCLTNEGECLPYWVQSGSLKFIDEVVLKFENLIQDLASDKKIVSKINENLQIDDLVDQENLLSFFVFSGYLNARKTNENPIAYELSIPNNEVKDMYYEIILTWFKRHFSLSVDVLLQNLIDGKIEEFAGELKECLRHSSTFQHKKNESHYSCMMNGLFFSLRKNYLIQFEQQSGKGFADTILIPKTVGKAFIFEYKKLPLKENEENSDINQKLQILAQEALKQIADRDYDSTVKQYPQIIAIYKIGIAFFKKEMAVVHKIEPVHKKEN